MSAPSKPRLRRALAPAFWTRWDVYVADERVGMVEKRGMGSGWYGHRLNGSTTIRSTRTQAVESLTADRTQA